MDVVGLYPHIPHEEGVEALKKALDKSDEELPVEFDEKLFRQKLGTAIGTKFAPGYANIFMGYLEEEFLDSCELRPWVWWRFLDDVFMIWLHGEKELNDFLARLSSFRKSIKFTWNLARKEFPFLM